MSLMLPTSAALKGTFDSRDLANWRDLPMLGQLVGQLRKAVSAKGVKEAYGICITPDEQILLIRMWQNGGWTTKWKFGSLSDVS